MYVTEGIAESLENIFGAVIVGGMDLEDTNFKLKREAFRECMQKFRATFTENIFFDEYAFLYEVINSYKSGIFTLSQLLTIIENHKDVVKDSPYINLNRWESAIDDRQITIEEKVEAFRLEVVDKFNSLSKKIVSVEEFNLASDLYIEYYSDNEMMDTIQKMALIMSEDGYTDYKPRGARVHYKGIEDAQKFYSEKVKKLRGLVSDDRIVFESLDSEWLEEIFRKSGKEESAILDFGLEEIDNVMGGLRRSNLLGILGPPKGAKTRMCNYLTHRALEKGLNVAVWPLEGTKREWEAMQAAVIVRSESGVALSSSDIMLDKFADENTAQLAYSAYVRLASGQERGKLSFILGTAYVEDFIEVLSDHYHTENPFDIIVIDSLINILSRGRKGKVERIGEAYMLLKDFIANKLSKKAIAIVPAQLKQETIDYLRKHPDEIIDVTAGGESAETIRSPDHIIGLFSNKDERNSGKMKLYSVGSRHNEDFDDFYVRCELGCCYFYSDSSLNI
jgi:archaellum biogenesis ATPase FlaH